MKIIWHIYFQKSIHWAEGDLIVGTQWVGAGGAAGAVAVEVWMVIVFTPSEGRRSGPSASVYYRYQNNACSSQNQCEMNESIINAYSWPSPSTSDPYSLSSGVITLRLKWNHIVSILTWWWLVLPVRVVKLVTEVIQNELEAAATEHLTDRAMWHVCSQPRGNRPGHAAQAPVCVVHHPPLIPPAEHLGTQEANAMVVVKIFLCFC